MKNSNKFLFIIVMIVPFIQSIQAYKVSFSNHITTAIAIGMKYKGFKNLEFIVVKPHEEQFFEPGAPPLVGIKNAIDKNKSNAIPSSWYYHIDPPSLDDNNKNSIMWAPLTIQWFKPDTYKAILKISSEIGNSNKLTKEFIKIQSAKATPEIMEQLAAVDYNLENFLRIIGKNIGHSMAQDFHIDIIQDENGNIHFIASL